MYTLGSLPLPGTNAIGQSTLEAKKILKATLRIIDGINTGPWEMTANLRLHMGNLRFHVAAALTLIDTALRSGGAWTDPITSVPGLSHSTDLYLHELRKAKLAWNEWIDDAQAQSMGCDLGSAPLPAKAAPTVPGPTEAQAQSILESTKPPSILDSLTLLGGAILVGGVIWAWRKL